MKQILKTFLSPFVMLYCQLEGLIFYLKYRGLFAPITSEQKNLPSGRPLKLAIVIPWFGKGISGGAETECYGLASSLQSRDNGIDVEIFTSTLRDFASPWNQEFHAEGRHDEHGLIVNRFSPLKPDMKVFGWVNRKYFMDDRDHRTGGRHDSPLPPFAEYFFLKHLVFSGRLLKALRSRYDEFDYFIYIPYMFASSALGARLTGRKSILIPCLHDEAYVFMRVYRKMMAAARHVFFHVRAEERIARAAYPDAIASSSVSGEAVNTGIELMDPGAFARKFQIDGPYLLYAGRKIEGKNLPLLVERFLSYKASYPGNLKLVIIGKGELDYRGKDPDIIDLGFVELQDKWEAFRGCLCCCQPSTNESFSIVTMESWLQKAPVLVNEACEVTKDHCDDSGGGFYFDSQASFDQSVNRYLSEPDLTREMGERGYAYVMENYTPEKVISGMETILRNL